MSAKKYDRSTAAEVPDNWAQRQFLLGVPQIMTITGRSYWAILSMVKTGQLRPVDASKPYRFAPSEVLRVFFSPKSEPTLARPIRSLKTEGKNKSVGHKTKPRREVLWP